VSSCGGAPMTDAWIDFTITVVVTVLVVAIDYFASWLVSSVRSINRIDPSVLKARTKDEIADNTQKWINRYKESRLEGIYLGTEFASMAFATFLAIYGVFKQNPSYFPFFSLFNTTRTSLEIPVWIAIIFLVFLAWVAAIAFKHLHRDNITALALADIPKPLNRKWIRQNIYMILGNLVGE
jgi:hypothetical protein